MQDSRPIVWYMTVSNRDAVTARGIAVGDSLKKVMDIYGRPDFIEAEYDIYAITVTIL